jgi:hypothetical protein
MKMRALYHTLAAALCLALAGAALGAKPTPPAGCQLRVNSAPDGAAVTLDGTARDVTPLVLTDIPSGEHLLVVQKPGFMPLRKTVILSPEQRMALDLQLEPMNGLLLVESDPPGAEVRVDDTDRGTAPRLVTDLRVGKHQVTIKTSGYAPRTMDVEIKDRKPMRVVLSLSSDSATVAVDSDPQGAKVVLNGVDGGTTPCTVERVPAGDAFLKLELEGYAPMDQILKLRAGQKEDVKLVLKSLPSELSVVSIPEGARVYVNNQFRGTAPAKVADAPPGSYRIRVELEGYESAARTVELGRAQRIVEEFRLEGNLGVLEVVTEPAGVRVFVDGKPAGATPTPPGESDQTSGPLTLKTLTTGAHTIQLAKEGYAAKTFSVDVQRNQTVTRHEKLTKLFIPDYEVQTRTTTERGMLLGIDPDGTIRLEVRPGVVKTIRAADARVQRPLRAPSPTAQPEAK